MWRRGATATAAFRGSCRLISAQNVLLPTPHHFGNQITRYHTSRILCHSIKGIQNDAKCDKIEIGGVTSWKRKPKVPDLVPRGYLTHNTDNTMSQTTLAHLRWMLQKDLLAQDMFLIGPPGPSRRWLAYEFCELTSRQVEYLAISSDTTETDLKQRREIISGSASFTDQSPVRAALNGSILVLDGLEKAERNVLPTLNNLLENREMTLDDGRFLMHPDRYDALLKDGGYSREDLLKRNIVRVHPDFRVIALGLPVPPYPGRTLDPPLRSRFQARLVSNNEYLDSVASVAPNVPLSILQSVAGVAETLGRMTTTDTGAANQLPTFPAATALPHWAKVLNAGFPGGNVRELLSQSYPFANKGLSTEHKVFKKAHDVCESVVSEFFPHDSSSSLTSDLLPISPGKQQQREAEFQLKDNSFLSFPCGGQSDMVGKVSNSNNFVQTPTFTRVLNSMVQDHAVGANLCLYGDKGCGKSSVAREFASYLGYVDENKLFTLFSDMTSRDLLQRRATTGDSSTIWVDSPLVAAAKAGHVVFLDGLHRLRPDTIGTLQQLLQDREVDLFDGKRLIDVNRLPENYHPSVIVPIHPSFRVIALAESPLTTSSASWLSSEVLSMFRFHHVPSISGNECESLLSKCYPALHDAGSISALVAVANALKCDSSITADQKRNVAQLSLRQLLRICKRINEGNNNNDQTRLRSLLNDTLMTQFMTDSVAQSVNAILDKNIVVKGGGRGDRREETGNENVLVKDGILSIGNVSAKIESPSRPELVPDPLYFNVAQHTSVLKNMLRDINAGQKHLLLIGNQGVGKNKLADRLLQLLGKEREYVQLHRDTTVQTLTIVPSLINGQIVWEDSPLVRAVAEGRTLVVDEADKAPVEVVCVLKGLIEDGEMLLADGRRLIDPTKVVGRHKDDDVIFVHPDFQMWVLANRPGFPFLGNNFFRESGDIFASHVIENPDESSELALLKSYAPSVPTEVLTRICSAFADLRSLVEAGEIAYPYSTREAVSVAKHLESFPQDGVSEVLENVMAFDAFDENLRHQIAAVFQKYDIPLSHRSSPLSFAKINLAPVQIAPSLSHTETLMPKKIDTKVEGFSKNASSIRTSRLWLERPVTTTYEVQKKRLETFSEELWKLQVPLQHKNSHATAMAALSESSDDYNLHVLTTAPLGVHSYTGLSSASTNKSHYYTELEDEYSAHSWEKNAQMVALPKSNQVAIHLPSTGNIVLMNPGTSSCTLLQLSRSSDSEQTRSAKSRFNKWLSSSSKNSSSHDWNLILPSSNHNVLIRYQNDATAFRVIDLERQKSITLELPSSHNIKQIECISPVTWLVQTNDGSTLFLEWDHDFSSAQWTETSTKSSSSSKNDSDAISFNKSRLSHTYKDDDSHHHHSMLFFHPNAQYQKLERDDSGSYHILSSPSNEQYTKVTSAGSSLIEKHALLQDNDNAVVDLKVLDDSNNPVISYRDIRVTKDSSTTPISLVSTPPVVLSLLSNGSVQAWQTDAAAVEKDLSLWKKMTGYDGSRGEALSIKVGDNAASNPKTGLDAPKHGKEDPDNTPHVGGNTWAGGTGGSDTAGLGGRGGPYRLDKGHKVHQVSQAHKDEVSAEAMEKARAIAKKELAKKLQDIDMTGGEWKAYEKYLERISRQVSQLRLILENSKANSNERTWIKHQSSGELDDSKLVDGVAGERLIFKRRGVLDNNNFDTRQSGGTGAKKVLFVMDVSGSMYRFNGQDGRLERLLETSMMIMESFAGFENQFDYSIVGHSGDSPSIPFVSFKNPPENQKARLNVLQKMLAHSQYCRSGDHTLEATEHAIRSVTTGEDADDYLVFVVSDANLDRYGISPRSLGSKLNADPQVKAHAIFIASIDDEADRILKALPKGRGFVCLDTNELPQTFKKIFTSHWA